MRQFVLLTVAALCFQGVATADTAYLKPSTFDGTVGKPIAIDASFSDTCCEPSYPVRTDTFEVINPDGSRVPLDRIENFSVKTVLEHTLTQQGTTRITTGERLGRKGEYVRLDGEYFLVNSPDATLTTIPEGTPILRSQTATLTDVYISTGSTDWGAVNVRLGRLVIQPLTHPNSAKVGGTFEGRVLFDGKPLSDEVITFTTEAQRLYGKEGLEFQTNADGDFSIPFETPGVGLIMVRMQAVAPAGAETDIRSYTTALTLNVARD